jgi:L-threonylcarbamoyladenylate synthase
MQIISLSKHRFDLAVSEALAVIKDGGVVSYPTESYYALGVKASSERALKRLYAIKNRPIDKAMPVIIGSINTLEMIVSTIPDNADILMERFWPGPLTMIFDANDDLSQLLTAGLRKVAARVPGEGFALSLAKTAGFPITATSANISSEPPASHPNEVVNYFGKEIDLLIDAGETPGGKPSTIVDVTVTPPAILREGRVSLN